MENPNTESNFKVAIRIRPILPKEELSHEKECIQVSSKKQQIVIGQDKPFHFDYVFASHVDQDTIFERCVEQLIDNIYEGYNSTVFAYGQTGSGKTYTMGTSHQEELLHEERGIIPRAIELIFKRIEENSDHIFTTFVSFTEVYKEEMRDLLDPTRFLMQQQQQQQHHQSNTPIPISQSNEPIALATTHNNIQIREDHRGNTVLKGVYEHHCVTQEEMLECLEIGSANRITGATQMNQQSSRSHCVFTVTVIQQWVDAESLKASVTNESHEDDGNRHSQKSLGSVTDVATNCIAGKFHFVDLAGSERAHKTGNIGDRFKESVSINSGLLALGNVISALTDPKRKKGSYIPYRDSKITRILRDSLGGNARTLMICCLSPVWADYDESVNAAKYANRARGIRNKPVQNKGMDAANRLTATAHPMSDGAGGEHRLMQRMQTELVALRKELLQQQHQSEQPPPDPDHLEAMASTAAQLAQTVSRLKNVQHNNSFLSGLSQKARGIITELMSNCRDGDGVTHRDTTEEPVRDESVIENHHGSEKRSPTPSKAQLLSKSLLFEMERWLSLAEGLDSLIANDELDGDEHDGEKTNLELKEWELNEHNKRQNKLQLQLENDANLLEQRADEIHRLNELIKERDEEVAALANDLEVCRSQTAEHQVQLVDQQHRLADQLSQLEHLRKQLRLAKTSHSQLNQQLNSLRSHQKQHQQQKQQQWSQEEPERDEVAKDEHQVISRKLISAVFEQPFGQQPPVQSVPNNVTQFEPSIKAASGDIRHRPDHIFQNVNWSRNIKTSPNMITADRLLDRFRVKSQMLAAQMEEQDLALRQTFKAGKNMAQMEEEFESPALLQRKGTFKVVHNEISDSPEPHSIQQEPTGSSARTTSRSSRYSRQNTGIAMSGQNASSTPWPENLEEAVKAVDFYKKQIKLCQLRLADSNQKMRDFSISIRLKEQLIKDLVKSTRDVNNVNRNYEDQIKKLNKEREESTTNLQILNDKLRELNSSRRKTDLENKEGEETKQIKEIYEKKIEQTQKELDQLHRKLKDSEKMAAYTANHDKKIENLIITIERMKQEQINLQKRLKEENDQKCKIEKDFLRDQDRIKQLEIRNDKQQKILQRKHEEIASVQKRLRKTSSTDKLALSGSAGGEAAAPSEQSSSSSHHQQQTNDTQWLETEIEKLVQQQKQMDELAHELQQREQILQKKEALMAERNTLQLRKLRTSGVQLDKNYLSVTERLGQLEIDLLDEQKRQFESSAAKHSHSHLPNENIESNTTLRKSATNQTTPANVTVADANATAEAEETARRRHIELLREERDRLQLVRSELEQRVEASKQQHHRAGGQEVEPDDSEATTLDKEARESANAVEARRLIELEETLDILDNAIQYKTNSIESKRTELRHSQIGLHLSRQAMLDKLSGLGGEQNRCILVHCLDKIVTLRDRLSKHEVASQARQLMLDELQQSVTRKQCQLDSLAMQFDRRFTVAEREHEAERLALVSQLAVATAAATTTTTTMNDGGISPANQNAATVKTVTDNKISELERELHIYKKMCRDMKSKIRAWVLSGRLKADIDVGSATAAAATTPSNPGSKSARTPIISGFTVASQKQNPMTMSTTSNQQQQQSRPLHQQSGVTSSKSSMQRHMGVKQSGSINRQGGIAALHQGSLKSDYGGGGSEAQTDDEGLTEAVSVMDSLEQN